MATFTKCSTSQVIESNAFLIETLPFPLAQFYAMEIVNMLQHMHSKGIAHRDIKPENILLDANYHLKLGDFGTAKIMDEKKVSREIDPLGPESKGSTFVGTAEYVSPEVLLDKESGPASDLWALGCILYQFFAGRAPFKGKTEFLTFGLIVKGDVSYPSVILNSLHIIGLPTLCKRLMWETPRSRSE